MVTVYNQHQFICGRQNDNILVHEPDEYNIQTQTHSSSLQWCCDPAATIPDHFTGPDNILLLSQRGPLPSFGQLLDDDPGHGVPAGRRVAPGVVGAGPHPHGHVHQPRFHTLTQPFNCKEQRQRFRGTPSLQTWKLIFDLSWHVDELSKTKPEGRTLPQHLNNHLKELQMHNSQLA